MMTDRDLVAGKHAAMEAMLVFAKDHPTFVVRPFVDDLSAVVAHAVIAAVDQSRNPLAVGSDIVGNLLRPRE